MMDVWGVITIVIAVVAILLPMNWGSSGDYSWDEPFMIALFFVFAFFLGLFVFIEIKVAKNPIIPMQLFLVRNFVLGSCILFLLMMAFLGIIFYVPVFFQEVQHTSATTSGLQLLPVVGGFLLLSGVSGVVIAKTGHFKTFPPLGCVIACLGFGLCYRFRKGMPEGESVIFLLIVGIGIGLVFQNCIIVIQASVDKALVPTATTSMSFMQNIGGVLGIAIAGSIFGTVSENYMDSHAADSGSDTYEIAEAKGIATLLVAGVAYCGVAGVLGIFLKKVVLSTKIGGEAIMM